MPATKFPHLHRSATFIFALLALTILMSPRSPQKNSTDQTARSRISEAYGKLPLRFETVPEQGGTGARFISRGNGYGLSLAADEMALSLRRDSNIRMLLVGANSSARAEAA